MYLWCSKNWASNRAYIALNCIAEEFVNSWWKHLHYIRRNEFWKITWCCVIIIGPMGMPCFLWFMWYQRRGQRGLAPFSTVFVTYWNHHGSGIVSDNFVITSTFSSVKMLHSRPVPQGVLCEGLLSKVPRSANLSVTQRSTRTLQNALWHFQTLFSVTLGLRVYDKQAKVSRSKNTKCCQARMRSENSSWVMKGNPLKKNFFGGDAPT